MWGGVFLSLRCCAMRYSVDVCHKSACTSITWRWHAGGMLARLAVVFHASFCPLRVVRMRAASLGGWLELLDLCHASLHSHVGLGFAGADSRLFSQMFWGERVACGASWNPCCKSFTRRTSTKEKYVLNHSKFIELVGVPL